MNKKQRNRNRETARLLYNKIVQEEIPPAVVSFTGKVSVGVNNRNGIYTESLIKLEPYWIGGQIVCYSIVN